MPELRLGSKVQFARDSKGRPAFARYSFGRVRLARRRSAAGRSAEPSDGRLRTCAISWGHIRARVVVDFPIQAALKPAPTAVRHTRAAPLAVATLVMPAT